MHHIRDCLPEIKSRLNVMTQSVTQQLVELGEPPDGGSASALGATLVREGDLRNDVVYRGVGIATHASGGGGGRASPHCPILSTKRRRKPSQVLFSKSLQGCGIEDYFPIPVFCFL